MTSFEQERPADTETSMEHTPLPFVKDILRIVDHFDECISEVLEDVDGTDNCDEAGGNSSFVEELRQMCETAKRLREEWRQMESIKREKVKVVLGGKVDSQKELLINLLIGVDVLPSGCFQQNKSLDSFHANCLVEISGCDESKSRWSIEEGAETRVVEDKQCIYLYRMLMNRKFQKATLLKMSYPKRYSEILEKEFVLVSTPALDFYPSWDDEMRSFVREQCSDCTILVLVVNAKGFATDNVTKNFAKLFLDENPNPPTVCVVVDTSDTPTDAEMLMEVQNFLISDLDVPRENVSEIVFFVRISSSSDIDFESPAEEMESPRSPFKEFQSFLTKYSWIDNATRSKLKKDLQAIKHMNEMLRNKLNLSEEENEDCVKALVDSCEFPEETVEKLVANAKEILSSHEETMRLIRESIWQHDRVSGPEEMKRFASEVYQQMVNILSRPDPLDKIQKMCEEVFDEIKKRLLQSILDLRMCFCREGPGCGQLRRRRNLMSDGVQEGPSGDGETDNPQCPSVDAFKQIHIDFPKDRTFIFKTFLGDVEDFVADFEANCVDGKLGSAMADENFLKRIFDEADYGKHTTLEVDVTIGTNAQAASTEPVSCLTIVHVESDDGTLSTTTSIGPGPVRVKAHHMLFNEENVMKIQMLHHVFSKLNESADVMAECIADEHVRLLKCAVERLEDIITSYYQANDGTISDKSHKEQKRVNLKASSGRIDEMVDSFLTEYM